MIERPAAVADTLVALVESASVNSTESVRPNGRWMQALAAPSRVHVRLEPPRHVRVMDAGNQEWRTQAVSEILVVVPRDAWPDHVLLKSDAGTVSVTKYSPCTLAQLVVEAELGLSDTPRYKLLESGCAKVKTHRPG
jgi:hypothetical protein